MERNVIVCTSDPLASAPRYSDPSERADIVAEVARTSIFEDRDAVFDGVNLRINAAVILMRLLRSDDWSRWPTRVHEKLQATTDAALSAWLAARLSDSKHGILDLPEQRERLLWGASEICFDAIDRLLGPVAHSDPGLAPLCVLLGPGLLELTSRRPVWSWRAKDPMYVTSVWPDSTKTEETYQDEWYRFDEAPGLLVLAERLKPHRLRRMTSTWKMLTGERVAWADLSDWYSSAVQAQRRGSSWARRTHARTHARTRWVAADVANRSDGLAMRLVVHTPIEAEVPVHR